MANYCLDSNVVSDILRKQPDVMKHLIKALDNDDKLFISSIVYYEVVRGLVAAGKTRMLKDFKELYDNVKHLYTANTKHFGRVEGLDFVNWRDYD